MTDEIFVSEKTGKRYGKIVDGYHLELRKDYIKVTEIIEPKLEVGDWVHADLFQCPKIVEKENIKAWQNEVKDSMFEIRKASGEIWVKENNEWRKK